MGSGIAQVAAMAGHTVRVFDAQTPTLENLKPALKAVLAKLREKGKISSEEEHSIAERVVAVKSIEEFKACDFVIEAVVEDLKIKQELFQRLEGVVGERTTLATNTSSLSVTSIGAALTRPERFLGVHFFNPAPLMPLVEIIPSLLSGDEIVGASSALVKSWGKTTVRAKDTPGFIVNRVARPFYGEALRLLEEGLADAATLDWAMRELGGVRMGPFELMDLIGNDVNYAVTTSVFEAFYFDPRYKPSLTQRRMVEARRLGRKSGRGYYDYSLGATPPEPTKDQVLGEMILNRILAMLINEAADAVFLSIASVADLDTAMTKGVNYPRGLLAWADEIGAAQVVNILDALCEEYREDRYRASPLLRRMLRNGSKFY